MKGSGRPRADWSAQGRMGLVGFQSQPLDESQSQLSVGNSIVGILPQPGYLWQCSAPAQRSVAFYLMKMGNGSTLGNRRNDP